MTPRIPMTPEQQTKAKEVGRRIALARNKKGFTQAGLAAKVGITSGAIAQYETGRNLPKPLNVDKISAVLDVSVDWLWSGDNPNAEIKLHTTAEVDAVLLFRDIPVEWQEMALDQMRTIRDRLAKKT